jgi:hypothetical protein
MTDNSGYMAAAFVSQADACPNTSTLQKRHYNHKYRICQCQARLDHQWFTVPQSTNETRMLFFRFRNKNAISEVEHWLLNSI